MTSWSSFLSLVLPEEGTGYYCIGSYKKGTTPRQDFAETIEGAEKLIQSVLDEKRDVYFGVSKFITNENRKAINAGWVKAFYLDLDCGQKYADEGKGYLTQAEALADLRRFCAELKLPKPNVVNSGNGIHASWALTETLLNTDWKATAELLKRQAIQRGLLTDPSKVTDLAMVLRIPDTLNFKTDPPKDVKWVSEATPVDAAEFKKLVSEGLENLGLDLTKAPRRPMDETTRALLGNYISNFGDIMKAKGCPQLIHIFRNQGTIEEPLWRAGLSIAQVCEDRDTAIHKLSNQHPSYSHKDTENKANATGGPYKCATIEGINPGGCANCPNKGKITSPVQIGKKLAKATEEDNIVTLPSVEIGKVVTYTIPEFPFPYFRGRNGGVYKTGFTKEDGEEVEKDKLICKHDFYVVKRMMDDDLGEMIWLRVHLPKDGVREFALPAMSVVATDEFKKIVSKYGVIGTMNEMKEIMEYITRFAQHLQELNKAENMRSQFGWCDNDTKFIIGDREISIDGVQYSPPSNHTLSFVPNFKPRGSLELWQKCVEVYGRKGNEARAFLFFTGFGAPLLKFTNQKGMIFSITENESGTGKTTIQRMVNSIWGHPTDMMLIQRDTRKSQYHQMGVHNNMPVCIDEVTDMDEKHASEIAYAVSQGRSNNRMKSNSNEMRINNTRWALPCLMSGNSSMHDKIAALKATPESEQLRIVEVEIGADKSMTKEESDELFEHVLPENYGLAADAFMEYVVANLPEVKELLKKTQVRFDKDAKLSQKQRFYSAGAAMAFTGAIIAKRLGLHDIDIEPVWKWAVTHFSDLRESVKPAVRDPASTLGKFLNSHTRNLLVIDSVSDKRTGMLKAPIITNYGDLLVRYEPDTKNLFIDADYFQAWCVEKQIAYKSTVKELKRIANAEITRKTMAKGTPLNTPAVSVIRIDDTMLNLVDVESLAQVNEPQEDDK
jgi:hypothetical protein